MSQTTIAKAAMAEARKLKVHSATLDTFPGWDRSGDFIKKLILSNNSKRIGDVGGGRMPRIDLDFIRKNDIDYYLFDISASELALADAAYHKIEMDVCCDEQGFKKIAAPRDLDLIFSHMLLEHLPDPMAAHRNFFKMLKPGGVSVHMFPSKNNFPLLLNSMIPESVSRTILRLVQPHRNEIGEEGKFEAFYHYCGVPRDSTLKAYEAIGYEVVGQTRYVGHEYYRRIPPLAALERKLRPLIARLGLPFISAHLLILRKPVP